MPFAGIGCRSTYPGFSLGWPFISEKAAKPESLVTGMVAVLEYTYDLMHVPTSNHVDPVLYRFGFGYRYTSILTSLITAVWG